MNRHESNIASLVKNRRGRHLARDERRRKRTELVRLSLTALFLAALLTALAWILVKPFAGEADLPELSVDALETTEAPEAVEATTEPVEDFENEKIEAALLARSTRLENVIVTHYDPCEVCCGKSDGITASGVKAVPGVTVAVDPLVIPMGSDVLVDYGDGEIHYYRAEDVIGGVRGSRIDLCVSDHETALGLGVRTATVYWADAAHPEELV